MDNQRNFILAAVLSLAVVFFWQMLVISPRLEKERAAAEAQQALVKQEAAGNSVVTDTDTVTPGVPSQPNVEGNSQASVPGATAEATSVETAGRIEFNSDKLDGTINLKGARIDDLNLAQYRETIDPDSAEIKLLIPASNENAYFAEFGWSPNKDAGALPGPSTIWKQVGAGNLTPANPVILEYQNDKGLTFTRKIELDDNYMFTVSDTVRNTGAAAVSIKPYGRIARFGNPEVTGIYVLHEGLVGSIGDQGLDEYDYGDIEDEKQVTKEKADSGWLGITDKYWATALIPSGTFTAHYNYYSSGRPFYQSDFLSDAVSIAAGGETTVSNRLFAGAKKVDIIDAYRDDLNIPLFDKIIDWGWFYFITKPLFSVMNWVYLAVGNFGVAILIVTVLLKILFFPLANKSYASMANMKKVQPEMAAIKERHGDDRQAQQKAMMALYKEKKINPASGCWPVLIQIPVFFALYKVIYVTIEMRQAPFFGWIQDLSAPDPTSIFNLFGLLPFEVPLFLMIGVWPLLMGITMFIQMQMNPTPPDPTQQMIFKWMPVVFTFMLATFPAGLVIYWAWNNFLSILQQGTIMKRQGAKIELFDNLRSMFSKKKETS